MEIPANTTLPTHKILKQEIIEKNKGYVSQNAQLAVELKSKAWSCDSRD
ncbi:MULTISPECIES: hypothetical protein [unclassified Nostoc]|nr:hypothetical protein [Nostoc sp. DedQUE03]MDZ7974934.1 hypothetical protein [Nostoc sp. DedQUE03]MDZ8048494.1 hypothetical protein [Nostoc sp. DedQUE02]